MPQSSRDIILQVLTLIGFEGNKEAYAHKFLQTCEQQALFDLLESLSEEKQAELKQKLAGEKDQEKAKDILSQYVTSDEYREALKQASQTMFIEFIQTITPTLSSSQNEKLGRTPLTGEERGRR